MNNTFISCDPILLAFSAFFELAPKIKENLLADKKLGKHFKNAKMSTVTKVDANNFYAYLNGDKMAVKISVHSKDGKTQATQELVLC